MYAAEMVGNCGITTWLSNSQVVHFVADSPQGPWTRQETVLPVWAHCPSAALTPNNTVVMWAFRGSRRPSMGNDAWGNPCKAGASPCGFAKHGCGPNAPPPLSPTPPPSPPGSTTCDRWASLGDRYACHSRSCLSDGRRVPEHCGQGLCPDNSTLPLCLPLGCSANYSHCPVAAAARCDADASCHGFALYETPWRDCRAQFFGSGTSGLTVQAQWTAFTKSPVSHKNVETDHGRARTWRHSHEEMYSTSSTLPLTVSFDGVNGTNWMSVNADIEEPVGFSIAAPWFLDNGTAFWVLQADCPSWMQNGTGTCGTIIRGETWQGPYEVIARGACSLGEDHSMYIDKRGHFHCLTHRFSDPSSPAGVFDASRNGGHAFSVDGREHSWFCVDGKGDHGTCNLNSPIAYNSTVIYQADGVNRFGTRERPHIVFDHGEPVALATSVQHCQAPSVPDACEPNNPHSCNQSNLLCHNAWPGYMDRSWTSLAPLRTLLS